MDEQIDAVLLSMKTTDTKSEEYETLVRHLNMLHEIKNKPRSRSWSWDTMISAGASLLGVLIIVAYEQRHVMASKGLNHLPRMK